MRKIIWWFLFLLLFFRISSYLFDNKDYFLRKFDPKYFSELYSQSQYVLGPLSQGGIGDDGLYAFAGYYYFFQGGDVSAVNFEHPPLGKYLIGFSIFLFKNENVINIFYFLILLYLTYLLGKRLLKSEILAILSSLILSFDPLFLDHLKRSLLDFPLTLFFITAIFFFLLGLEKEKCFYLSFLFFGMAFSTRFFPIMVVIYFFLLAIVLIYRQAGFNNFLKASFLLPVVYLFSHLSFFFYHPSIWEFLRHKKWMLSWFTGSPVILGNIWRNIFTGAYLDSTQKLRVNEHWSLMLPFIFFLALTSFRRGFFVKNNLGLGIIYSISLIYLGYVTFLTNGLQKFLMPIFPLLIILSLHNLYNLYSIIKPWVKKESGLRKKS